MISLKLSPRDGIELKDRKTFFYAYKLALNEVPCSLIPNIKGNRKLSFIIFKVKHCNIRIQAYTFLC